jgi:hypothetical protein
MSDLEQPLWSLTLIEAVIKIVTSECPEQWSRYCALALQLAQQQEKSDISQEDAVGSCLRKTAGALIGRGPPLKLRRSYMTGWRTDLLGRGPNF